MKIVAFGASTSSTSINKLLATYAANQVEDAQVNVLDLNNYQVPMFSEDKEKEIGQAEGAVAFLRDLAEADAIVVSFAEHNAHTQQRIKTCLIGRRALSATYFKTSRSFT